jgi:NADPH:quinone reductase-like Zn-dependent oxidoreductase
VPRGGRPRWLSLGWDWLRTPRYNPLDLTNHNKSVMAFNLSYLFEHTALLHEAMAALSEWADAGALRPAPVRAFPLRAVAAAHAALESGQTVGKLVLVTPVGERAGLLEGGAG